MQCFRIGHIGRIFPRDTRALLAAIDDVCKVMGTAKYAN
jgi:aspartate aminotransferase-like enzyme